ncbi:lytic murein transglycosylase [Candidatus Rhodobacter oscarellae]|uniref:lytic murein transglycosylase n=1 Tax=Candidatus Rhodobacter oscarellae TaxID=1675527 RepID=UPI00128F918C|nr:lytic murein transglycosylase [Candidatus Rhodobacter lobularis]
MNLTRRSFSIGATAALLSGCAGGGSVPSTSARGNPALRPAASPQFDAWLTGFRARAAAQGISEQVLNRALRGAAYLPGVIERDQNQFHKRRTLEDYVAIATSQERLAGGRAALRRAGKAMAGIEDRFGVPPEVMAAIWGVETRYGTLRGDFPTISSLATLGFASRRARFFEGQLLAALRILQRGDTTQDKMVGSWAGAMGHTQFIPTTFEGFAVDFDGDGRRDVWAEDPTDALASTANYLAKSGWVRGPRWGYEVRLPTGMRAPSSSKSATWRSFADWTASGIRGVRGERLPKSGSAGLIRPSGDVGPALLITKNFNAIRRYNNADNYVIAVGHLSDRLAGRPGFSASFGPDEYGLTLQDRLRLQNRLAAKGYEIGTVDGVIGKKTLAAIEAYQRKAGLAVTGLPSRALLAAL